MAVEDYMEPEVAVAVAVTAAVASPKARRVLRQGAVYGLAGLLKAGDALGAFGRGVSRGVQTTAEAARAGAQEGTNQEPAPESPTPRSRPARQKVQGAEEGSGT